MTKVGNLLRASKALISDPSKWIKGAYVDDYGCMCAQGALNEAYISSKYGHEIAYEASLFLKAGVQKVRTYRLVTSYNDDPETTHADIMNLFDDAAAMADATT